MARSTVAGIDWVLHNVPATTDELLEGLIVHVDYDPGYLLTLLRDMRDAGLIACVDRVWYTRTKPA